MIKALIFDLDGTLFDSSEANIRAYSLAFNDMGLELDIPMYREQFGLRFPEMMKALVPGASEETLVRIKYAKAKHYQNNLSLVKPNTGLVTLLHSCQNKFKTALVTTASQNNVTNLLGHFNMSLDIFDAVVMGEDVNKSKPDSECYIIALKKLGVKAAESCVFEDSDIGIKAALGAGIKVIKVRI